MAGYILVIDDEPAIAEMLSTCIEMAGFQVRLAANGEIAYQMILQDPPDLVLADWMMPMLSGIELTRKLRRLEKFAELPIILLTARAEEDDKVTGLDAGADDYIAKPFSPREVVARIKAVLRRGQKAEDTIVNVGSLKLDRESKRCFINQDQINLGPLEYRLLEFFVTHQERVFSREQLLDQVWGNNVYVEDRTVDVHIRRLRQSISSDGNDKYIQTVRGAGYRFSTDNS